MFARLIGPVDELELSAFTMAAKHASWKAPKGREYQTAFIPAPDGYKSAFFVKLPPHTAIHAHVDAGDCETEHVVIETNPKCWNFWLDGKEKKQHMHAGNRYLVDRKVLHWASNDGDTDRVHLLLER